MILHTVGTPRTTAKLPSADFMPIGFPDTAIDMPVTVSAYAEG